METTVGPAARRVDALTWRNLLSIAALAEAAVLVFMAVTYQDTLAAVLAVAVIVGFGLLHLRRGPLGMVLLGLLFGDISVWTVSGAVANFLHGEALLQLLLPAYLGLIAVAGLIGAGGSALGLRGAEASSRNAWRVLQAAVAALALVTVAGFVLQRQPVQAAAPAAIQLDIKNMAFSSTVLEAKAGQVTVHIHNHDLWWHTFTIDKLGVNVRVPMGAEETFTFNAPPGVYTFYCAIPGHKDVGMQGTLTVK